MTRYRFAFSFLMVVSLSFLLWLGSRALVQEKPRSPAVEYKVFAFGTDEKENTRKLNDLVADGWEYVGSLGNSTVAFKRIRQDKEEKKERTLWVYEGGWYQKIDGKNWIEVNYDVYDGGKGKFEFEEVNRTDRYVELYDKARKVSSRHHDDHQEARDDGATEWTQVYKGRWKK